MKDGRRHRRNGLNWPFIIISAVVIAAAAILTIGENWPEMGLPSWSAVSQAMDRDGAGADSASGTDTDASGTAPDASGTVRVHFLDTGQSDCILITTPGKNVLIDAGNPDLGYRIVSYMKKQGVEKLDLAIATHPHSDHIGSMAYILNNFGADELLMPRLNESVTPVSTYYDDMLDAAARIGCLVTEAQPGLKYELCDGAYLYVLGPVGEYEDLNDWSVVTKLVVGEKSFLFMGDAEAAAEADILSSGADVSCDVLKVGHHGGSSSSGDALLEAAAPEYAVILVGAGNDYGHPADSTLERLERHGAAIYRTDLDGTVVASTDGHKLTITTD